MVRRRVVLLGWFAAVMGGGCREPFVEPDVRVALDAGDAVDGPTVTPDVPPYDGGPSDVGPEGGTVGRLHFGVFGDVRPPNPDDTANYPTAIISQVMAGMQDLGAQFGIGTGDYMFANSATVASAQLDLLAHAEAMFHGRIFHAMGNHECDTATAGNCPLATETGNITQYRMRLASDYATPYFDWTVETSMGSAHFIVTAPNAWSSAQQSWLATALASPSTYTFVVAHEAPTSTGGPGSMAIEQAVELGPHPVTLRLYGHTHDYRRIATNAVISGNAGAPLSNGAQAYGFVIVDQRADGAVNVTAYEVGTPPVMLDAWGVRADGSPAPP